MSNHVHNGDIVVCQTRGLCCMHHSRDRFTSDITMTVPRLIAHARPPRPLPRRRATHYLTPNRGDEAGPGAIFETATLARDHHDRRRRRRRLRPQLTRTRWRRRRRRRRLRQSLGIVKGRGDIKGRGRRARVHHFEGNSRR